MYNKTTYYNAAELEESKSIGGEFLDLTRYGITASAVSGGVGIVNSFGALANAFGADYKEVTTAQALENLGMKATAAYAREHKTGVEFAGLIAGSIVPGALGIKLIRGAQNGLRAYEGASKVMKGLRAAAVPVDRVKEVADGLAKGTHTLTAQFNYTMQAAKQGFHQQMVESLAAETAILLTMNQHSTLNDSDLGYFESIKENLGSAAVGLVLGGGVGGLAATLSNRNEMYGALKNVFGEVREHADVLLSSKHVGIDPGDAVAIGIDRYQQIRSSIEKAKAGQISINPTALKEMQKSTDYIAVKIDEAVNRLVKDSYISLAPDHAEHVAKSFREMWRKMPEGEAANFFGGATKVKAFSQDDTMFGPNIQSIELFDDIDELAAMRASNNQIDYAKLSAEDKLKWRRDAEKAWLTTNGFAYIHRNNAEIKAAVLDNPERSFEQKLFTMRHELGHLKGAPLARVMDTKFGRKFKSDLVEISRKARPQLWAAVDAGVARIPALRKQLKEALQAGNNVERSRIQRKLAHEENIISYAHNNDELIADTLARFDDPIQYESLIRQYGHVGKVLTNNATLRARLGEKTTYLDLQNQNMFKQVDREPTLADLGEVKIVGKSVVYGKESKRVDISGKFDPMKATAEEASAHYFAAFQRPLTSKDLVHEFDATDLPSAMRVVFGLKLKGDNSQFNGKVKMKLKDGVVREYDFTNPERVPIELDKFRTHVAEQKVGIAKAIAQRNASNKGAKNVMQETELARLLDTDIEWARDYALQRLDPKFNAIGNPWWSEAYRPDKPTMAKVVYNSKEAADPMEVKAMSEIYQRRQAQYQQVAADIQGAIGSLLPKANIDWIPPASMSGANRMSSVNPYDDVQGFLAAQQGTYGSATEFANNIGTQITQKVKLAGQKFVDEIMMPVSRALIGDQRALAELAVLDSVLRQAKYKEMPLMFKQDKGVDTWFYDMFKANTNPKAVVNTADERYAATKTLRDKISSFVQTTGAGHIWQKELQDKITELALKKNFTMQDVKAVESTLDAKMKAVGNQKVMEYQRASVQANSLNVSGSKLAAANKGKSVGWDEDVWYPGRLDRSRYDLIAFVRPSKPGLFGESKYGIVGAPDQATLDAKISQLKNQFGDDVQTITAQGNSVRHKEMLDDYDAAQNIDEYYMNYGNENMGVAWDLMPDPSPQLVQHKLDDMKRQWSGVTDQLVSQHYAEEFGALEALEEMRLYNSAQFGTKAAEASPYSDYLATMLNRPNDTRFKAWRAAQQSADKVFSTVWNTINGGIKELRGKATTANYKEMNDLAEKYGIPQVYGDMVQDYIVRTESVSDSVLADIVPQMNWFGATAMLRLDFIQPIVNAISMPILAVPELKHLIDALPALKREQLTNSLTTAAVDDAGQMLAKDFSNTKLMMQAAANWHKRPDLREAYKQRGLVTEKGSQYFESIDQAARVSEQIAAKSFEKAKEAAGKAVDIATSVTDWSEDFVRFVAADMARMVLEAGGITGSTMHLAQRTYVNRVVGNYTYAQRPGMFQGFAGQAIGLFQTYQFNLTQQLLRHLGDKPSRALALMGIQSATFGLGSTPGFELLNQHVYERSNFEGDFYTGLKNTVGTDAMEWAMYGLASNFTKLIHEDGIDLYSRGNLTPRSATVVPTSLEDLVVVNMATKAFGALGTALDNLAGGVPVSDTIYQAMATNGLNRPLQGIGQLLAGERTTRQGSMLLNTSDLDWVQRTARIMGARGLNEAVAVSNYYRAVKFETARNDSINSAGRTVKQLMMSGSFDGAAYGKFMEDYTSKGGDINYYDKWVSNLYNGATQSQIYDMSLKHNTPEGRYMQEVMGGEVVQYINPFNIPEQ